MSVSVHTVRVNFNMRHQQSASCQNNRPAVRTSRVFVSPCMQQWPSIRQAVASSWNAPQAPSARISGQLTVPSVVVATNTTKPPPLSTMTVVSYPPLPDLPYPPRTSWRESQTFCSASPSSSSSVPSSLTTPPSSSPKAKTSL